MVNVYAGITFLRRRDLMKASAFGAAAEDFGNRGGIFGDPQAFATATGDHPVNVLGALGPFAARAALSISVKRGHTVGHAPATGFAL